MSASKKVKYALINAKDKYITMRKKQKEVQKYSHPARVKIYSQVELTHEQRNAIDDLYVKNYGKKIPYTWHRHFAAFTGRFCVDYFPELLYIPVFEKYMNLNPAFAKVLADKNALPLIAKAVGIRMPVTYISRTSGALRGCENQFITPVQARLILHDLGDAFVKPSVDSSSGRGCFCVHMENGVDTITGKTAEQILKELPHDFVIQERLRCHESLSKLYPGSVNTFRIITYRWKDAIEHIPVIMRIGKGGATVDNAHAGGMFIALDDDGTLHEKAFTEFKQEYTCHPDTGVVYAGYRIDLFPEPIRAAKQLHEAIPQMGVVNWDFTIDQEGQCVLIEANTEGGSVWLSEMAHGCAPFGERTAEILRWLRKMNETPVQEWNRYAFGMIEGWY